MKTMRNLLIYAACLAALLSCDRYDGVTIANNSADPSQVISFAYDGAIHKLNPGQSRTWEVAWYTPPPSSIKKEGGGTVKVELTGHYQFIDAEPIALLVVNNYSRTLILEAEDYIDADDTNPETKTTITLNPGEKTTDASSLTSNPVIYTKKPNFRVKLDGTTAYINVPVKYHYSYGGTIETGQGDPITIDPAMSVVIGP
jgi:hypothetical protein